MKQELTAGPFLIRLDFMLVIAGAAVVSSPQFAACLALVIAAHELGHAVAARRLGGGDFRCLLQLAGGRAYVRTIASRGRRALVLLAGPISSGLLVVAGARLTSVRGMGSWGYDLFFAAVVWTAYQLAPFPPVDGGQLIRVVLEDRVKSATWIWRLSWLSGFAWAAGIVALDRGFLGPAIWLTGTALILGRGEAGYVRHLDAWAAWEKGDYAEVVRRIRALPDYLDRRDRVPLISLGVTAALELQDPVAVEELCGKLPPYESAVIQAATWLLIDRKPAGAQLAERAFDALDAERITRAQIDQERWSEMAFRLAVYEAGELRGESALGVLERAIGLGYAHRERIEAEPAFARLTEHLRWVRLLERL